MGFLDGGGAALLGEIFAPLYLPASVYITTTTHTDRGEPRRSLVEKPCLAQVDGATQTMRQLPEFAATDRAAYILASSFDGAMAEGHEFVVHRGPYAGNRWKIADPIDRDPCAAYWLCRVVLGKAAQ